MAKLYFIKNKINGKQYIGYTSKNSNDRILAHFYPCMSKLGYPLYKAMDKYGRENFEYGTLYEGEDALEKEDSFIRLFGDYNMVEGGGIPPSNKGKPHSKEHIEKIVKALKGRKNKPLSDAHKAKMSASLKGKRHTPESYEQGRLKRVGAKRSEETKQKLREAWVRRKRKVQEQCSNEKPQKGGQP